MPYAGKHRLRTVRQARRLVFSQNLRYTVRIARRGLVETLQFAGARTSRDLLAKGLTRDQGFEWVNDRDYMLDEPHDGHLVQTPWDFNRKHHIVRDERPPTAAGAAGGASPSTIVTITASYKVGDTDLTILADATAGDIIVGLPPLGESEGRFLNVVKIDSSVNHVILDPFSSGLINGDASLSITAQHTGLALQAAGGEWRAK